MPVIIPTVIDNKIIKKTKEKGTYVISINPTPLNTAKIVRISDNIFPHIIPNINPPSPPNTPIIIDSVKNKS